jgi:integrase
MTRPLPRYVNGMTVKGRRYYYFRKPGAKPIRLPDFGTPDFEIAYQRALHGDAPAIGADRTLPGTLNAAIVSYYGSLAFRGLAASSQALRRSYLERFREKYGNSRLATMPSEFIVQMMNKMEPFSARNWVKCVRAVMQHAISIGLCKTDPTQGVKLPKTKSDGIRAWTEAEIAQFEAFHPIGSKPRLAMALGLYTGQRRSDVVRMGRQHIRNGAIEVRQQKTRTTLEIPLHPNLINVIEGSNLADLTFLTTKRGKPFTPNDFSDDFRSWCDAAGLSGECKFHGLRVTAATRLADVGCSVHEIAAITGHKSIKEVERYTRSADQVRLARQAIARTKLTNS